MTLVLPESLEIHDLIRFIIHLYHIPPLSGSLILCLGLLFGKPPVAFIIHDGLGPPHCGLPFCVPPSCEPPSCGLPSCGPTRCGSPSCGPPSYGPPSCEPPFCVPPSCGPPSCGLPSCGPLSWQPLATLWALSYPAGSPYQFLCHPNTHREQV